MHEPELSFFLADEWMCWLADEKRRGRVAAFGVAGPRSRIGPILEHHPGLVEIVQVADSLGRREADFVLQTGKRPTLTYGYMSAARASGSLLEPMEILSAALRRNRSGTVLVSTRRRDRVPDFAKALVRSVAET